MKNETPSLDAAQVGKMFVTAISFQYHDGGKEYNHETNQYNTKPGRWEINATLSDKLGRYEGNRQTMSIVVEHGVGQKLAEILLPVIVADASKKAQELADSSKTMLEALGERAIKCIADMPTK